MSGSVMTAARRSARPSPTAPSGAGPTTPRTGSPAGPPAPRSRHRTSAWLGPGWPLAVALCGFPLWWVLGISAFVGPLAAVFMLVELARRRALSVPKGFGWWALILVWVALGVVVLQVNAPGAVPGYSSGRYFTWAFRLSWYVTATVTLLYVGNLRHELPTWRVSRILSWMFLTIAAGGWIGMLAPHLDFPSLLEAVLPHRVASQPFVNFLIHPAVVQDNMNSISAPRPSAPFGYANIWGLNFAVFVPFFIHAWFGAEAGWRRSWAPPLLLLALVPAVASLNRGLWLVLVGAAVLVAILSALRGRVGVLALLVAGGLVLGALLVLTPAGDMIAFRLANGMSESTRSNLGLATVESVTTGSPVVGFGTTRDVQGSFLSIAGGDSGLCPSCSPPALGTQGHLWLVVFSQGLVGLFFYLAFYVGWFVRGLRIRTVPATVGVVVLFAHLLTLPIYDYIGIAMVPVMVAVAFLWRELDAKAERAGNPGASGSQSVASFLRLLQQNTAVLLVAAVLGTAAAWFTVAQNTSRGVATLSVYLEPEPAYLTDDGPPSTMDTEAFLARDDRVLSAMSEAVGHPVTSRDVFISANPNTRILNLRYEGLDVRDAAVGARAAQSAILQQRADRLSSLQKSVLKVLSARSASLDASVNALEDQLAALEGKQTLDLTLEVQAMRDTRARLISTAGVMHSRIGRASSDSFQSGGDVVRPVVATDSETSLRSILLSGALVGLLVGLGIGLARRALTHRLGQGRWLFAETGLPLLAVQWANEPVSRHHAAALLRQAPDPVLVNVDGSAEARDVISSLEAWRESGLVGEDPTGRPGAVVLVARTVTRTRAVRAAMRRLSSAGHELAGVVLTR